MLNYSASDAESAVMLHSHVDQVISFCVCEIWGRYDTAGRNVLDKAAAKRFVCDSLATLCSDGTVCFDEAEFERCFHEFDRDDCGTIEKSEMVEFVKQVAGF